MGLGVAGAQQVDAGIAESSLRIGGMHCAACAGTWSSARCTACPECSMRRSARPAASAACAGTARAPRSSACCRRWPTPATRPAPDTAAARARLEREREARLALWRLFVAAFCAMQVMMLAAPAYLSAPGELAPDLQRLLALGRLAADAAGAAASRRRRSSPAPGARCASGASAWTCRWRSASRSPSSPAAARRSTPAGRSATRSTSTR